MRSSDANQRRVVGSVPGEVALASVDVAYEGLVRVAPANPAGRVDVCGSAVRPQLGEDLVLAQIDALVRESHRRRSFLAAQRVILVIEGDPRNDVPGAESGVDRAVCAGRDLVQITGDAVELVDGGGAAVSRVITDDSRLERAHVDSVKAR